MSDSKDDKNLKFSYGLLQALGRPDALEGFIRRVRAARNRRAVGRALGRGSRRPLDPPEMPVEDVARELLRREQLHLESTIADLLPGPVPTSRESQQAVPGGSTSGPQSVKLEAELADLDRTLSVIENSPRISGGSKVLLKRYGQHQRQKKLLEKEILGQRVVLDRCKRNGEEARKRYDWANTPGEIGKVLGSGTQRSYDPYDKLILEQLEQHVIRRSTTDLDRAKETVQKAQVTLDDLIRRLNVLREQDSEWEDLIRAHADEQGKNQKGSPLPDSPLPPLPAAVVSDLVRDKVDNPGKYPVMRPVEVCETLGVSKTTFYRNLKDDKYPLLRVSKKGGFLTDSVLEQKKKFPSLVEQKKKLRKRGL